MSTQVKSPALPKSLTVVGRRWFNRLKGHTYYSAEIYVDGESVHKIPYAYGYGTQYECDAFDWLEANGYLPGRQHHENGSADPPWAYCQDRGIQYTRTVSEVRRKKDL
jgi:hypothetical protein